MKAFVYHLFDKEAKNIQWNKKTVSSINGAGKAGL